jgi:stearoyl-CoA desaturase (delta-9 desaturase)
LVWALGEGYHNNHHAKPRCAAHGLKWWEFDFTRYCIWMLEKVHLAWSVVWPEPVAVEQEEKEISPAEAGTILITTPDAL